MNYKFGNKKNIAIFVSILSMSYLVFQMALCLLPVSVCLWCCYTVECKYSFSVKFSAVNPLNE